MDVKNIAIDIIKNNIYLTLATTDGKTPWAAPLHYCFDSDFNLIYISHPTSLHSQNIKKSTRVAFTIFDSTQAEGAGNGIQGDGTVIELDDDEEIKALKVYKTIFVESTPEKIHEAGYKVYEIIPEHFYIQDPNGDERIEVKL